MRGAMRRVGFIAVVVVLLLTGVMGIRGVVDDIPKVDTLGKAIYTILLAAAGCLGFGAGAAVLARTPWAKVLILGWAATVLAAVLISAFVWPWPGIVPALWAISFWLLVTSLTFLGWKATARSQAQ
jgi:hypothetical protein